MLVGWGGSTVPAYQQVVSPNLAGVRTPRQGGKPAAWMRIDRDYESLRTDMQVLFSDLGIVTSASSAAA